MASFSHPCLSYEEVTNQKILKALGLREEESLILVILFRGFDLTLEEIVGISGLSDPEAGIGIVRLSRCRWVRIKRILDQDRRYVQVYNLAKPAVAILEDIHTAINYSVSWNEMM